MKVALVTLVAAALVAAASATSYTLTASDVTAMQATITAKFGMGNSYRTPCNPCTLGDTYGALVRLVFHDAAGGGGPNGDGGMNGCTGDNNGLQEVVGQLDSIYTDYASKIFKADFGLLAANLAIQYATTTNTSVTNTNIPLLDASPGTLYLPFNYGRIDDATCDDSDRLPGANYNWTQMKTLFTDRMGLTTEQIVAIMGAHALGRAETKNSGFAGGWGVLQSTFSNFYYHVLGAGPVAWTNSDPTTIAVWNDTVVTPSTIMLTVDVEPMLSPSTNCKTFHTYAGTGACKANSESNVILQSYAASNTVFFAAFSGAWQTLTQFEYTTSLAAVGTAIATETPTTASPTTATPTTATPTTVTSTTASPTTATPTTASPTTTTPTTATPTTATPTTATPTTASPTDASTGSSTSGLSYTSQSIVIGVVVGVAGILLVLLIVQTTYYYRHRQHQKTTKAAESYANELGDVKTADPVASVASPAAM